MPATYAIELDESQTDLKILNGAGYNFALAKAVSTDGQAVFNTIFQTNTDMTDPKIGPYNKLTWTENYGLNYTTTVLGPGATVTVSGKWQPVNIGDYYSINGNGFWEPATGPISNALNVINKYQEVSIVIGIQGSEQQYRPVRENIFFDPYLKLDNHVLMQGQMFISQHPLLKEGTGSFEPLEGIQLWWGTDQATSTMIAHQQTPVEQYTLTAGVEVYFNYDATNGVWKNQLTPFDVK